MDMKVEGLAPGVEHADHADHGPQMFGVRGEGFQSVSRRLEEDGVDHLLVHEDEMMKLIIGQGEDGVMIFCAGQFGQSVSHPLVLLRPLALRTVPVLTRVEGPFTMPAMIAFSEMVSHPVCAAIFDRPQHAHLTF